MDIRSKVVEWCRTMCYDGEIPSTLENICSHSTSFLWQELLQNARTKQEVEAIRVNVILRRVKEKPLEKQDDYTFPMREMELYRKKQELEKKKRILQEIVKQKKSKAKHLAKNTRVKCMSKELFTANVKESTEKDYLLNLKARELQKQIAQSEETLTTTRSITPIELDESPNKSAITETLHKCVEKLLILVQNTSQPQALMNFNQERPSVTNLIFKTPSKVTTMDYYFTLSKQKNFNEIPFHLCSESVHKNPQAYKKSVPSENLHKKLFEDIQIEMPKVVVPEAAKVETVKQKKSRESLGILHESYLVNASNDSFLLDMESVLSPVKQNELGENNIAPETENLNDSTVLSLISLRPNKELNSCSGVDPIKKQCADYDKLLENDVVNDLLQNLIYSHNRQAIWNVLQMLNDNLCIEITNRIVESSKTNSKMQCFKHDFAKLHLIHVQNGLRITEQKLILRELLSKFNRWKTDTFGKLKSQSVREEIFNEIKNSFELKLEDVRYDAALTEMKKQIQLTKQSSDSTELQVVVGKISKVKDEIMSKTVLIQQYIEFIKKINSKTAKTRDSTRINVQKVQPFICDMSWSKPLTETRFSEEIKLFERFPLEFNRVCQNVNSKIHYRDLCVNSFPLYREWDSDSVYMLSEVLKNPFSPPEAILMDFIKMETRLQSATKNADIFCEELKSLKSKLLKLQIDEKDNNQHLHHHNGQIKFIIDKLNSILFSPSAHKILSLANTMKKAIDTWEEMHLEEHIPPSRLVDGFPYKHYDNKFNLLLENLRYKD